MAEDRRQPYIAMPEHDLREPGSEPAERRSRPRDSVGRLLRRTREHYGQDLRTVADTLRIRHAYLGAIEESRFDELPGPTYAVGFVRSYADYLGLDDDEVVRRFKEEVDGLDRGTQLHFPAPVNEGRIPGGAILLVSLVFVAAVYGGWYYLSSQGTGIADLIPAVPERLQAVVGGQGDTAGADGDADAEAASVAKRSPEPGGETATTAAVAEADAPTDAGEATAADDETDAARAQPEAAPSDDRRAAGTATSEAEGAGEEPAEAARGEPPATSVEEAATAEAPAREPAAAEASGEPAASEPASEVRTATLPAVEPGEAAAPVGGAAAAPAADEGSSGGDIPAAPSDEATAAALSDEPAGEQTTVIPAAPDSGSAGDGTSPGRVYGGANRDARIVLRATQDSWVQVRDADDTLLLTRVLRAGDSYRVPNRTGLTLVTGNAGGLTVVVDGQAIPALGPVGAVRRGIELDPAELQRSVVRNN